MGQIFSYYTNFQNPYLSANDSNTINKDSNNPTPTPTLNRRDFMNVDRTDTDTIKANRKARRIANREQRLVRIETRRIRKQQYKNMTVQKNTSSNSSNSSNSSDIHSHRNISTIAVCYDCNQIYSTNKLWFVNRDTDFNSNSSVCYCANCLYRIADCLIADNISDNTPVAH